MYLEEKENKVEGRAEERERAALVSSPSSSHALRSVHRERRPDARDVVLGHDIDGVGEREECLQGALFEHRGVVADRCGNIRERERAVALRNLLPRGVADKRDDRRQASFLHNFHLVRNRRREVGEAECAKALADGAVVLECRN